MQKSDQTPADTRTSSIGDEIRALREEVHHLNSHRFIRLHDSLWKLGLFQLYRGLAFGLGSVLGATFLVAVVVQMLSSIDFIPVIGNWAQQIIEQINAPQSTP
ncbi:hypothetical protein SAMN04488527_10348 [Aliiroseovarius crassostreae]|uniref:DUF5665 domain-containing protein n=1 Tax=Aliiroseovarius crassostreae TaxID=154981 RepID=UPI0008ED67E1|nr:DUF5665 domain-containing protein [Aliiroseovarius crassostreae]SFU45120.1 hypothetical protein SAMN04488527_10348 [Aliiroseovarius crassostreae]